MLQQNNFNRRAFFINMTQHAWSKDQIEEIQSKGYEVADLEPNPSVQKRIKELLTFDTLPTREEMTARARQLAHIAHSFITRDKDGLIKNDVCLVMIGGAPWFMSVLENELRKVWCYPIYAFSQRVSEEVTLVDGTVEKRNYFKHEGFIYPQG